MTKTILVIEDDSAVAGLLDDVLTAEGFTVIVEPDGEWGLRTFEERRPDLVMLDVLLPKLQGFEVVAKLRAVPGGAHVPVIVMSGVFRSATYREKMVNRHKVRAYFDKPLNIDALLDTLHDVFSSGYPTPKRRPTRLPSSLVRTPSGRSRPLAKPDAVEVPAKGDLQELPFARLLGLCFRARITGALMVRRSSVKKIIYFKEGVPVFVRSNLLQECLGRVMIAERLISQKECERSLETRRKEPTRRQGEILVAMGSISQHNLQFALELQIQMKLFELFSWQEGTFQLNPQGDYNGPQVALSMSPTALVHEGALRSMSTERIRRDLSSLQGRALLPSTDPTFRYQALQLDPRADRLLDLMDGTRNAETLLHSGEIDLEDAALVVYALVCTGLLRAPGSPPSFPKPVSDDDLEVLSTGEIDVVSALAEVDPKIAAEHPAHSEAAGKARARALALVTNSGSPPPHEDAEAEQAAEAEDIEAVPVEAQESVDAEDIDDEQAVDVEAEEQVADEATIDIDAMEPEDVVEAAEASELAVDEPPSQPEACHEAEEVEAHRPAPSALLPRASTWTKNPSAAGSDNASSLGLSEELRQQVRARLEAQAARLASQRSTDPEPKKPRRLGRPTKRGLSLDLDKERTRIEEELRAGISRLEGQDLYTRLELQTDADATKIAEAYEQVSRKLHPDRVTAGLGSPDLRLLAEQRHLLIRRAHATLENPATRQRYRTEIGLEPAPEDADLVLADEAFERGRSASALEDWATATEAFEDAVHRDPTEALYISHLAWATYAALTDEEQSSNEDAREHALDLLRRAAELNPRHEQVYLYAGRIQRKGGRAEAATQAYERALRCNPDCMEALSSLRELQPKEVRRTGFLSRLGAR